MSFARKLYGHLFDVGIKATKRVLKIDLENDYVTKYKRLTCLRDPGTGPVPLGFGRHLMHDPISHTHSTQKHP